MTLPPKCPRCSGKFIRYEPECVIACTKCGFKLTFIELWENKHQLEEYLYDRARNVVQR